MKLPCKALSAFQYNVSPHSPEGGRLYFLFSVTTLSNLANVLGRLCCPLDIIQNNIRRQSLEEIIALPTLANGCAYEELPWWSLWKGWFHCGQHNPYLFGSGCIRKLAKIEGQTERQTDWQLDREYISKQLSSLVPASATAWVLALTSLSMDHYLKV